MSYHMLWHPWFTNIFHCRRLTVTYHIVQLARYYYPPTPAAAAAPIAETACGLVGLISETTTDHAGRCHS